MVSLFYIVSRQMDGLRVFMKKSNPLQARVPFETRPKQKGSHDPSRIECRFLIDKSHTLLSIEPAAVTNAAN